MKTTELELQNISIAAGLIPENTPIVMLNLVRYREHADYGDRAKFGPCSGREAYYQRYVGAFNQIAARSENTKNIRPVFIGAALATLVGPAHELWDDVVLVEYPNFVAFRSIVERNEYKRDADPHRKAALENWRLIATLKPS